MNATPINDVISQLTIHRTSCENTPTGVSNFVQDKGKYFKGFLKQWSFFSGL